MSEPLPTTVTQVPAGFVIRWEPGTQEYVTSWTIRWRLSSFAILARDVSWLAGRLIAAYALWRAVRDR